MNYITVRNKRLLSPTSPLLLRLYIWQCNGAESVAVATLYDLFFHYYCEQTIRSVFFFFKGGIIDWSF